MDARRKVIDELTERMLQNQNGIRVAVTALGEYLAFLSPQLGNSALAEPYKQAQELKKKLPTNQKLVRKIVKLVDRSEVIEAEQSKNRQDVEQIQNENDSIYEGMGMAAYEAFRKGEIEHTGIMVHLVPDEEVDAGPVVAQEEIEILPEDTVDDLEERVHAVEHRLLVEALHSLLCASGEG